MLKRLIYILLLLPIACIDPYQVDVPEGAQLLTVEASTPVRDRIRLP